MTQTTMINDAWIAYLDAHTQPSPPEPTPPAVRQTSDEVEKSEAYECDICNEALDENGNCRCGGPQYWETW
jgi:hypothetical protein